MEMREECHNERGPEFYGLFQMIKSEESVESSSSSSREKRQVDIKCVRIMSCVW